MVSQNHPNRARQPSHIRLPQQSEKVIGPEAKPGAGGLDARTVTQDPALKPKQKLKRKPT